MVQYIKELCLTSLVIISILPSCKRSEISSVSLSLPKEITLTRGQEKQLDAGSEQLDWSSSDPTVATVSSTGIINAKKLGSTDIKVTSGQYAATCKVSVVVGNNPLSLSLLNQPYSGSLVYSANVLLKATSSVMQCFDLENQGNIYYTQLGQANGYVQGKTTVHELYVIKGQPDMAVGNDYMTLKYFGHGGGIAMEEDNGQQYVWINSNATKYASESGYEYNYSKTVSRIKYESGKIYGNGYAGDTYFLDKANLFNFNPAIDSKNKLLCINATQSGGARYFYTYNLDDVKKQPLETFNFSVTIGGEENGLNEQLLNQSIQARNLLKVNPVGAFSIPKGSNLVTDVNSYSFQGFDIDGDYIYFLEGAGNKNDLNNGASNAYVTVFNLQGKLIRPRTKVMAIANTTILNTAGITSTGYMEAEGLKVKEGTLYLGFASRSKPNVADSYSRANIWMYK